MSHQNAAAIPEVTAGAKAIEKIAGNHQIAVVMGSGWADALPLLGKERARVSMTDLPGFAPPTALGHAGQIVSVDCNGKSTLVFLGRTHLYEGHGIDSVVHGVRTAIANGAKIIILTNACGGINLDFQVGQPVIIKDHISLTGVSPLSGANFVDLTTLYSPRLRSIAKNIDPSLPEGVYVHWRGPTYETPAEIRMMRTMGADMVGMSTVPEAIAAHALGAEVFGLSLVTNAAAGVTGEKLSHDEVMAAGKASAIRMGTLLAQLIEKA